MADIPMPDAGEPSFHTGDRLHNLTGRTISGGFVTGASQALKFAMTLGSAMILGRLLAPQDFGLVGMASAVVAILNMFSDVGLSAATVQARTITPEQSSNLFWLNVGLSGAMGGVAALLTPVLASFYHEPKLISIGLVLALTFPFAGLAFQHRALLNRQMNFRLCAIIEVSSMLASTAVGCAMALLHCGYWSLAGMQLSASVSTCVLFWCGSRWRPGWPSRKAETRPLLRFGLHLTAAGLVNSLTRGCDVLLLGKMWGTTDVGLYSRASGLLMRPLEQFLSPISGVLQPVLSRLQGEPERYRRAFLRSYDAIGLVSFPVSALILATAHPLVMVLLGPQWEGAVAIFAGFTAAALYLPLALASTWLFTSQGRSGELLKTNLVLSGVTVLAFLIGLPYGAFGMALCFSLSGLLVRLPLLYYWVGRRGPVRTIDLWRVFVAHVPSWVTVYASSSLACALTNGRGSLIQLLASGCAGLAVATLTICLFSRQRQTATELAAAVKASLGKTWRRPQASPA